MSTTHIKPTLGRIVWYRGEDGEFRAAIITGVNSDFNVNLNVFGHHASDVQCGPKDSVTHANPEKEPLCFPSWGWMPYQLDQAKKAEKSKDIDAVGRAEPDRSYLRAQAIEMALRTPNLSDHHDVLEAALAYQLHIENGTAPTDAEIVEAFRYQLSIDGGDAEKAAISTVRLMRGEWEPEAK